MRTELVVPARASGVRIPCEDPGGPFVVPWSLLGIPWRGISGAVIDEVELRVIGDETPHIAATVLPGARRPRRDAEILTNILRIERLEFRTDENIGIRSGAVRLPHGLAGCRIERSEPAANTEFAAGIAHQHLVLRDERRHGERLALVEIGDLDLPAFLAGIGIDRDGVPVQRVEEQASVGVSCSTVDHVAAGRAL